jgi:hypothetical protein
MIVTQLPQQTINQLLVHKGQVSTPKLSSGPFWRDKQVLMVHITSFSPHCKLAVMKFLFFSTSKLLSYDHHSGFSEGYREAFYYQVVQVGKIYFIKYNLHTGLICPTSESGYLY